jgi:Protein of unknown function (DUF2934)
MSDTDAERERRIRERAYFLWLEAGCPDGRSIEFWNRARMLQAGPLSPAGDLPSSVVRGGSTSGVASKGHTDLAIHPASPSSTAPPARPVPRSLSLLLAIAALILGMAWVAGRFETRRAGGSANRWTWL